MNDIRALRDLAVSESGFVFDPRTGSTYTLNPTGVAVLEGLKEGLGREGLADVLRRRFDSKSADLHRDVDEFVRLLQQAGLVAADFTL